MKTKTLLRVITFFIVLLLVNFIHAQTTINGSVIDNETSEPLPGVNVIIKGTFSGVSTDFDGTNVTTAIWEKQNVAVPGEDIPWYAFQDVGLIDVSSYSGNLYVAFKYVGSGTDTSLDGGYFVDDVLFLKK